MISIILNLFYSSGYGLCMWLFHGQLEKNIYSAVLWSSLRVPIRFCWLMVLLRSIFLLIFCLMVPSITEKGMWEAPSIIVRLFISSISFISFLFFVLFSMCLEAPPFSTYTFRIAVSFSQTVPHVNKHYQALCYKVWESQAVCDQNIPVILTKHYKFLKEVFLNFFK